jgi:hypothetical protein
MACKNISGKSIRRFRHDLNMTQPKFADWLSIQTGENIESIMICRMENFGARDACSPLKPTTAVNNIICPCA